MLFPLFLSPLEIVRDLFYVYEEKAAKQNPKLTNQTSHALLIFFSLKVNMLEILTENQLSGWEEQIKEVNGKKKNFFQYYAFVLLPGIVILRIRNSISATTIITFWEKV